MKTTAYKQYKKAWDEMTIRDEIFREELRKDALKMAEKLKTILIKEFGVRKIVLFGSIIEKGSFSEGSDIDIAVEGLAKDSYFAALARLIMECPFEVDLKPVEEVSDLLRQRIARGKVLYEKRKNS